jgi:hypothetical protein
LTRGAVTSSKRWIAGSIGVFDASLDALFDGHARRRLYPARNARWIQMTNDEMLARLLYRDGLMLVID